MTDPSTIPVVAKGYVATLWIGSLIIMPLIITAAVAQEQAKAIKGDQPPNYAGIIWTSIAVSLFMMVYSSIFMLIPNICWWVASYMFPEKEWYNLFARLNDTYWSIVKTDKSIFTALSASVVSQRITMHFFHFLAMTIEDIFLVARFTFLGVLYILGPLVGVLSIHPMTRNLFKGWVMSVLQVSLWVVVLRALQALVVACLGSTMPELGMQGSLNEIVFSVVIILMFISVPLITSKIFTGQNIGTAGSLVIGGAMFLGGKVLKSGQMINRSKGFINRTASTLARRAANSGGSKEKQR